MVESPPGARSAWVAYPALEAGASGVNLKLYPRRDQALAAHRNGVAARCVIHCARDVKFLKRHLALPEEVHPSARYLGGARALEQAMVERACCRTSSPRTSARRRASRTSRRPAPRGFCRPGASFSTP